MTERLYRHPTDRVIAGVAGGLATWLNIDPSLVRIAWVLLAIFTGGAFVLVYIVMMIVVPLPPPGWTPRPRDAGWTGQSGGWGQPRSTASWGPTAAPGGALSPTPGWGEPPRGGWGQPATPAWGDPAALGGGAGTETGADGGSSAGQGPAPAWGSNTAPTQAPWTAPSPGSAGIVVGVVLVLVGLWFLVDQYVDLRINWDLLWPVIIMVLGGLLIAGALMRGRNP